jgi:hypothetical protein
MQFGSSGNGSFTMMGDSHLFAPAPSAVGGAALRSARGALVFA